MPYTPEQLEIMGEENTQPIVQFPRLNFDGGIGVLVIDRGEKTVENIDKFPYECIILSIRVSYKLFVKDENNKISAIYFTNESKSQASEFILKKTENKITEIQDRGTGKELQDNYGLKMIHTYYVLNGKGEVLKLDVGGKSLRNAFDYYKQFGKDEHKIDFKCLISINQEEFVNDNQETITYYAMTFDKGEPVKETTKPIILKKLEMLGSKFGSMDKLPAIKEQAIQETETPKEPSVLDEEDIDVKDIPF